MTRWRPKPIQKPSPPIYLWAFRLAAAERVVRLAGGWITVAYPVPAMVEMIAAIRAAARRGRPGPGHHRAPS